MGKVRKGKGKGGGGGRQEKHRGEGREKRRGLCICEGGKCVSTMREGKRSVQTGKGEKKTDLLKHKQLWGRVRQGEYGTRE